MLIGACARDSWNAVMDKNIHIIMFSCFCARRILECKDLVF